MMRQCGLSKPEGLMLCFVFHAVRATYESEGGGSEAGYWYSLWVKFLAAVVCSNPEVTPTMQAGQRGFGWRFSLLLSFTI